MGGIIDARHAAAVFGVSGEAIGRIMRTVGNENRFAVSRCRPLPKQLFNFWPDWGEPDRGRALES
jgi:hypothetical protein